MPSLKSLAKLNLPEPEAMAFQSRVGFSKPSPSLAHLPNQGMNSARIPPRLKTKLLLCLPMPPHVSFPQSVGVSPSGLGMNGLNQSKLLIYRKDSIRSPHPEKGETYLSQPVRCRCPTTPISQPIRLFLWPDSMTIPVGHFLVRRARLPRKV